MTVNVSKQNFLQNIFSISPYGGDAGDNWNYFVDADTATALAGVYGAIPVQVSSTPEFIPPGAPWVTVEVPPYFIPLLGMGTIQTVQALETLKGLPPAKQWALRFKMPDGTTRDFNAGVLAGYYLRNAIASGLADHFVRAILAEEQIPVPPPPAGS